MSLTLGDNFSYLGTKPLDGRIKYSTISEMVAMSDSTLYDGILAYCVADGKSYQWKSTNEVDVTLGKWREFSSGSAVDSVNGKTGVVVLDANDVGALPDNTDIVDGASYDSVNHLILFKQGSTTLFSLDAAAFVKDGMVDTVSVTGGNLVITFNTDAGKQDISIPLTDIFNPSNYYTKTATDGLLVGKADKTDVASDIQDVYEVMGKNGAKNLNSYPYVYTTREINGITFTDNGDGTVTANGTATADAQFNFHERTISGENKLILKNGNYIISGCPIGGSTSKYYINANMTSDGSATVLGTDIGEGATITLNGDDFSQDNVHLGFFVKIKSGQTVSNLVFKPMIRYASDTDNTYVPYSKTNRELTIDKAEQAEVNDIVNVYGAKNLLPYPYQNTTATVNGVTFTDNGDGTITANGTATELVNYHLHSRNVGEANDFIIKNGTYIVTGTPIFQDNYGIGVDVTKNGAGVNLGNEVGNGKTVTFDGSDNTPSGYSNVQVRIFVRQGTTLDNVTFKPMIRCASISDDTWQPYVKTNKELMQSDTDIYSVMGKQGAKNLIPYPYNATTGTTSDVTYTDNGDGTFTASGTADGLSDKVLYARGTAGFKLKAGTYILSGAPQGSSDSTYSIYVRGTGSGASAYFDYGDGVQFTLDADEDNMGLYLQVRDGQTVSNLVFKPMLRLASDTDETWQPYAMTNQEITPYLLQSETTLDRDTTNTNSASLQLCRIGKLRIFTGYVNMKVAGTSSSPARIAEILPEDAPINNTIAVCGRGETDSSSELAIASMAINKDTLKITYQGQTLNVNMFFNITWLVS